MKYIIKNPQTFLKEGQIVYTWKTASKKMGKRDQDFWLENKDSSYLYGEDPRGITGWFAVLKNNCQLIGFPAKKLKDTKVINQELSIINLPIGDSEHIDLQVEFNPDNYDLTKLTCYDCCMRESCEYCDDLYNTDGDCLQLK
jgi:hypothetical protein